MKPLPCPHCGENVRQGVKKWRKAVVVTWQYQQELERRILAWTCRLEAGVPTRGTSRQSDYDEICGLRSALSMSHTVMNTLIYSHHPHISFVIAERRIGHLPSDLRI